MTGRSRVSAALLAVFLTIGAAACATTTIRRVSADPSRYRDREVTVTGRVVDSISLGGRGAYRVDDETGSLWIISDSGVPRTGARVSAKGRIRDAFDVSIFGGRINLPGGVSSGMVMLESSHRLR